MPEQAGNDRLARLSAIGLDEKTAKNILANEKLTSSLLTVIDEAGVADGCDKATGNLLYAVAAKFPLAAAAHRPVLAQYIASKKIKTVPQLDAALAFLQSTGAGALDVEAFQKETGVGVVVTPEEIRDTVKDVLEQNRVKVEAERYRTNIGLLLGTVTKRLRWADGALIRTELDAQMTALLGPKTEADTAEVKKKKKEPKPEAAAAVPNGSTAAAPAPEPAAPLSMKERFDFAARELNAALNPPDVLERHRKVTGGKVITRFPPEPNGHLHLGHAKAMWIDYGYAKEMGGECIMRFDDTNPEAEKDEYIQSILEDVKWMGHSWAKVTYSSDYFQELYDLGVELIKRGKAFVCHQTGPEMKACREKMADSPYRNRSVEENLKLFNDMRKGKFGEGEATLRMKGDMSHPNPCMRDQVAYRVKMCPHPHVGDKWCVYPTYDYTHCLVDSLENVTHSLCTLEFEIRRDSYYWLLEALDMYRPHVWEFNRLNVSHNVLSKRRLIKLVNEGYVSGWDDPRMFTIKGLRRRGYTPSAINTFCETVGVSRNDQFISIQVLENCIRNECDNECPRAMAVLHPLKVTITNYEASAKPETVAMPNHPKKPERGTHSVPFGPVLYIEKSDFRLQDSKDYYGLAPGKEVMLRNAYNITCTQVKTDERGEPVQLLCTYDPLKTRKPKGVLHWVADPAPGVIPATAEVRLYDTLFSVDDLKPLEDKWLSAINPSSLVKAIAHIDTFLAGAKLGDRFQFERTGYFVVDPDTRPGALVFNRTVSLKDSFAKQKS